MKKLAKNLLLAMAAVLLVPALAMAQGASKYKDEVFLSSLLSFYDASAEYSKKIMTSTEDASIKAWANAIAESRAAEVPGIEEMLKKLGGRDDEAAKSLLPKTGPFVMNSEPDRQYVKDILALRKKAVDLATEALASSKDPAVQDLALKVIKEQSQLMRECQDWIHKWEPAHSGGGFG